MIRSRWIPLLTAVLNQGWFCPQKTFGKVWRQFMVVTTWMGKMKCYKPLNGHKARDAAKHVTAPNNKELSSPKCQHCWGWTSLVYKSTFQGSDPKVSACSLKAIIVLVGKVLLEKPNQLAKEFWDDLHTILFNSALGLTSYQIIKHRSHELCKKYCSMGRIRSPLTPCHRF